MSRLHTQARMFGRINFRDLVKNSPIFAKLKSPQKFLAIRYVKCSNNSTNILLKNMYNPSYLKWRPHDDEQITVGEVTQS